MRGEVLIHCFASVRPTVPAPPHVLDAGSEGSAVCRGTCTVGGKPALCSESNRLGPAPPSALPAQPLPRVSLPILRSRHRCSSPAPDLVSSWGGVPMETPGRAHTADECKARMTGGFLLPSPGPLPWPGSLG